MALTGPRITASAYEINGGALERKGGTPNGRTQNIAFGPGVMFYAAPANTKANGVTINAIIQLLPTGLNVQPTKIGVVQTVAEIISGGA